ncbi:MAG TPA: SRPBCC domain-containing protein [Caulobacteraceae bacterium]
MTTTEAELARFIDRDTVEYVRTYPHPIERVWNAITDPAQMSDWFGPLQFEPRLGSAWVALWEEDSPFKGVITAFEPPRLVRFGSPHINAVNYWQFELESVTGGTRMVFTQLIRSSDYVNVHNWPADPPEHPAGERNPWRPGTLSGWHRSFDHLGVLMDGGVWVRASQSERDALDQRYRDHMLAMQP